MATSIGGWFDKVFFDAHGEPCASGELRFYQTGTDVPQGVATFDGTPLGAVIRLDDDGRPESDFRFYTDKIYRVVLKDADGVVVKTIDGVAIPEGEGGAMYNPMTAEGDIIVGGTDGKAERLAKGNNGDALKIVNGVPKWTTDETGMANPMTTKGDLIVGATGGEPDRLGVGNDGDILASALFGGDLTPTWEAGPKKYRNVYKNIPSPDIDDGYLGCLFYLDDTATLTLPATANIPSKSFIDFVFLADAETLTITPQGTTTLNGQGSAVTIGGKSASFYRLTFLGHGGSGDEWAVGGTDTATQPGDHKTAVDGADASPDYLANKLSAGSGISLTNTGNAVEIAATTQTGDHQLLVSATDAASGYLGAKLTAGSNITLTQQTDGDGVQTLEISATGGGGGGGGGVSFCEPFGSMCDGYISLNMGSTTAKIAWFGRTPLRNTKIKSVLVGTFGTDSNPYSELGIYAMRSNRALTLIDKVSSYTLTPDGSQFFEFPTPVTVGNEIIFIGSLCAPTLTWRNTCYTIMQTTTNASLISQMQKTSGVFLDANKNPVIAYPFATTPNEPQQDVCSRRGFYWPTFSLSTLPASTTSSDWHVTGSWLALPYVAIETIS